MLILIVVVLYFNSWNTTRLVFKNRSHRWPLLSLPVTIVFAFSLSQVNLIDYKEFNKKILSKSVYNNYTLEIPRTSFHEMLYNRSLVFNIYVVEPKNNSQKTILWADGEEIHLKDIRLKVTEWKGHLWESDQPKMTVKLNIHSGTKMQIVNELKEELSKCMVLRVAYSVAPSNTDIDSRFYRYNTINSKIPLYGAPFFNSTEYYNSINSYENPIILRHLECQDSMSYNGARIHILDLVDRLKADIADDPENLIKYYFEDSLEFENYITVISSTKQSIKELRESYSLEHFSKKYDDLYGEEYYKVKDHFQYRLLVIDENLANKLR